MQKKALIIALIILLSSPYSRAFAQSPQISSGLSWLYSSQTASGNWPQMVTTDYYSTAAALDAAYALDPSSQAYSTGFQWLSGQIVSPTDYLARQIIALKRAGQDTSADLASLLLYRGTEGGWGMDSDYVNEILDTALALQALSAINYSDTTLIGQSLSYLTTNQNTDGGWGFTPGDASNTYVTSFVLRALSAYNSVFINQTSINQASAFLLAYQNTDGGFGNSPSTVYDTALSLMSMIESGQGSVQTIQNGINYLTTSQLADGSWNDDPYSTALALQALAEAKPNLAVSTSGITFSNSMPLSGATTTISAVISNTGYDNASNVMVRFYLGDPAVGGTQIGTDQIIPLIALGSSAQASITTSFSGTGADTIFVVADPDNLISETNKLDNKASARLWVATGPDLAVYSSDLIPSTYVPTAGTAFTLNYTIRNIGESPAGAFTVALYDGDPANNGVLLQTADISGVSGSDMRTGTIGVTLTTNGSHTLYLVADSGNVITEISKTNNTGSVTVNVGGTLTQADLTISPTDIILNPSRPHAGDTVQIAANVHNIGADAANNFTVEIFDGAPESGGTLINSQTISLVAGGSQLITASWAIPSGIHDVYVILDRANQIIESNENNNRASVRIMTDMVDIEISATDLVFNPPHPVSGDSVALTITAHNTGIKDTGAFNLAIYNGDPSTGGVLLQTFPISDIAGDGSITVTYSFIASPQVYRFYAVADPENVVVEMYEDNNTAIRSLTILSPGETLGPDLVPVSIDLTNTTTDPQSLAISGTAHVTFQNTGDDKITTSFNVSIFEDKDGDGKYTAGVDNLLGTGLMSFGTGSNPAALWPEGVGAVDVPLSGAVTFLHSPLYAFVDSGDAILEQNEDNNHLVSCKDCQVVPTNPIQATVKWKWGIPSAGWLLLPQPTIMHLRDTNGDGKIDQNDVPDIVLPVMNPLLVYSAKILAFKGDTGENYASIYDINHHADILSYVSSGDFDGDGKPEIIFETNNNTYGYGLVVYNNDWTMKWDDSAQVQAWKTAHPSSSSGYFIPTISQRNVTAIADLKGDGNKEIISGPTVINADGSVRCAGYNSYNGSGKGYFNVYGGVLYDFAAVVDLNLDGQQEIVAGNAAYDNNCNRIWWKSSLPDGAVAIANFDGDPYPEIVLEGYVSGDAVVYLLDNTGNIKWGPVSVRQLLGNNSIGSFGASPPIVADFDGDGKPEIGIRSENKILVLNKDGQLKNTLTIPVYTSSAYSAAPTVFDLDGDGIPKVMINSGGYFTILSGKDGTVLYQEPFGGDDNVFPQNVTVADVDGDGQVELVVTGHDDKNNLEAMRVYHSVDPNHPWSNGRRIYNQPSYHVTNVNDDGSIPQHEAPSWLLNNTYQTQASIGPNPNPYLTPNLTASDLRIEQAGLSTNIAVRVGNGGAIASTPTVTVTYYDGDPAAGGTAIGTASTTKALNPGDFQDVVYNWAGGGLGLHHIYAVVDAANAISECRKDDNQAAADVTIVVEYPDLTISPQNIALPAGPYYEGTPIPVTATISNIGGLSASNVVVRLYNGNPATGGVRVGTDQVIASISAGGTAPVTFSYDTLGKVGTNVLYIVVDPANAIVESSKANNSASVMFQVQQAVLPDLAVSASDIQLTPASPSEGNALSVSATIHNQGASTSNVLVNIYLGNPSSGGMLVSSQTIYPVMALGSTAMVQASLDTTGWAGQQQVYVVVDPASMIIESREDNNMASQAIFIQSAGLAASLTLDKATYNADDTVTETLTVSDNTGNTRYLTLGLYVKDSAGNLIATISTADPVTVNANSSVMLTRTWNTAATLAGQYTVMAEFSESGRVISRKVTGFTIASDTRMSAGVTTDKISYNPNDTAALSAVITSQSRNTILQNLSATLTIGSNIVTSPATTLFTDTKAITSLMPGATYNFKDYWNIGTYPSGTYPVTLIVRDLTGTIIATGTQTLTITNVINPASVLRGQISVGAQELLSGQTATVSYNVTNVGNIDLQNVTLTVLTVNVSDQTVYDTFPNQATLAMGGSTANTILIDTTRYTAKDYLVILQATVGSLTETLSGAYFRIEGAPSSPSLVGPVNGSDVLTFTPTLTVNNASDPNDDKLTYQFELYSDSALTQLTASSDMLTQGTGTTSWTVPLTLTENQTYYWRSRAYDNWLYGPWMAPASFRVNTVDDPPTAPLISSPTDGSQVATYTPVLTVTNATDPDSPSLTYNFDVALDPGFTQIIATTTGVMSSQTSTMSSQGTTSWQVPANLVENNWYYWRAQADDWFMTGLWSTTASFFVNTTNEPPTMPVITAPANNATIAALDTDIAVANSTDPDSSVIAYFFEVDTVPTFDSPNIIRSGSVAQGQSATTWRVTGLTEDTQYYVRVKASDGQADSPWSTVVGFFANAVNEPPTAPTLANPSNAGAVTVFTPTLSVYDSTDPDRDALTYDFEVYSDSGLITLVTSTTGVAETSQITSWTVPVVLTENQTYYWRTRAFDGKLYGPWMPQASFMVNTADDAPSAPSLSAPADGSSVATLTPTLAVVNATDPDSPSLTYDFEIYSGGALVTSIIGVPGGSSGITSATPATALTDNTIYQWRCRAYDGQLYGPWTSMASFTVHLPQTGITATIDFDPDTLNKSSNGTWVVVYIELPAGYNVKDIDVSSIRLEGTIPAETWPYAIGDQDKDGIPDLMVKFKRSDVIGVLPLGDSVPVHVTGKVGPTAFDGVDVIRVIN